MQHVNNKSYNFSTRSQTVPGFNMIYRNEDSILDQIYENQIILALYYEDLNSYLRKYSTHKIGF